MEVLFYVIERSVTRLQNSALQILESTNLLKILFAARCDLNQKANTFYAICKSVSQLTGIIIEEASKDFMTCITDEQQGMMENPEAADQKEVKKVDLNDILCNSKIIYKIITCLVAEQHNNTSSSSSSSPKIEDELDKIGIPSDQPKEIFIYGETLLRHSKNPILIKAGWLLLKAALSLESNILRERLHLLEKFIEEDPENKPNNKTVSYIGALEIYKLGQLPPNLPILSSSIDLCHKHYNTPAVNNPKIAKNTTFYVFDL